MNIDELLKIIKDGFKNKLKNGDISFLKDNYEIEGNIYESKCKTTEFNAICGYIQDENKTIRFFWDNPTLDKYNIINQHVTITGNINTYENELQIKVRSLKPLGNAINIINYKKLEDKYKEHINENMSKKLDVKYEPQKIAVITTTDSHGYQDFKNKIYNKDKINYFFVPALNAENVTNKINEICNDNINDVICIIRGGLDWFEALNDDELLSAIINAKKKGKYIVTGLGHSTVNNLLCDRIANATANNPEGAADIINSCLWRFSNKKKENKIIHSLKTQRNMLFIIVFMLICYIAYTYFL